LLLQERSRTRVLNVVPACVSPVMPICRTQLCHTVWPRIDLILCVDISSACSALIIYIWSVITIIGVIIVIRSLRNAKYEMAYIAAFFALNDGGSVRPYTCPSFAHVPYVNYEVSLAMRAGEITSCLFHIYRISYKLKIRQFVIVSTH
jgi:hypothetical protein